MKKFWVALFCLLGALLIPTEVSAQILTVASGGQTGTSGTNWSITGVNPKVLTATGNASIAPSVLQTHLQNGVDVEIWTSTLVLNADVAFSSSTLTLQLSGNSSSGTGKYMLGTNAVLEASNNATISNPIELLGNATIRFASIDVEYLVVGGGGGGGGGYDRGGGGGGGGGMVRSGQSSIQPGVSMSVVVGAGGAGAVSARPNYGGSPGNNSSFGLITALAGAAGQGSRTGTPTAIRTGGQAQNSTVSSAFGGGGGGGGGSGGGGGGAGGAGSNGALGSAITAAGGAGIYSSLSGLTHGVGGHGGKYDVDINGSNGAANTGNGGGAASSRTASSAAGGAGGSGIVVVKYRGPQVNNSGTISTTTAGGISYTTHRFTTVGTSTFTISEGQLYVTGGISGTGSIQWDATGGTVHVSNVYAVSGTTTVQSGNLKVLNDNPAFTNATFLGTGKLTIEPVSGSFTSSYSTSGLSLANTLTGFTLGKSGNSSDLTLASAIDISGPIEVFGGNLAVASALKSVGHLKFHATGTNATLTIHDNVEATGTGTLELDVPVANLKPGKSIYARGDFSNKSILTLEGQNTPNGSYSQLKVNGTVTTTTGSKIIQQQYLEAGQHLMAAPFVNATAEFFGSANTTIGGVGTTGHSVGNTNLWSWNGTDWVNIDNNGITLQAGAGYSGNVNATGFRKNAGLHSFEGKIPIQQVTVPLNKATATSSVLVYDENTLGRDGWNLIANPFTCALDYSKITRPISVNAAIYRWKHSLNNGQGGYEAHSPAGATTEDYIAPLQAFWVQTNSNFQNGQSVVFNMNNHGTVSEFPVFHKTDGVEADRYRLLLSSPGTGWKDACFVAVADSTTDGFDPEWDAYKLKSVSESIEIFSKPTGFAPMANNAISYAQTAVLTKELPLGVSLPDPSLVYEIALDRSFSTENLWVLLEDLQTQKVHDLTEGPYSFMDQGAAADRFVLKFVNAKTKEFMASSGAENGLLAWFEGSEINVWTEGPFSGQYSLFGLDGKQHQFGSLRSSEGGMLRIPLKAGIQPGIYLFRTSENRGATSFAKILVTP